MRLGHPPIILDIVEEHFEELDFLWEYRDGIIFAPDYDLSELAAKIGQQQSAVSLEMIDRPRIDLVHEKARRRLDQYRRRARIAGRGVRTFLDLDYSYDPANYHPLGIKLFSERIRPPSTRLRAIIEEKPRPRSFAAPADVPAEEKERTLYTLSQGADNPYTWEFDLCNVTLSNFKYRKMSLVRDYDILREDEIANPAFDATFSLVPRPVDDEAIDVPSLHERFDVVACDPTQATAIAEATQGTVRDRPATSASSSARLPRFVRDARSYSATSWSRATLS